MGFNVRHVLASEATDAVRASLVDTLTDAFKTYRPWTGVWTSDPAISRAVFDAALTKAFAAGWEVWVAEGDGGAEGEPADAVLGVAIWVPPGVEYDVSYFEAGIAALPARESQFFMANVMPAVPHLGASLPGHATAWSYLAFLGTVPCSRGRGVGSALLAVPLRHGGPGGPRGLSTGTDENEAWYAARGFALRDTISVLQMDGWEWTERLMSSPPDAAC